jgi:hypothetical protein
VITEAQTTVPPEQPSSTDSLETTTNVIELSSAAASTESTLIKEAQTTVPPEQ